MTDWDAIFKEIKNKNYAIKLHNFLMEERKKYIIYPKENDEFNAFKLTPYNKIKVVIFGQDPYYHENQAMGLAFSVPKGVTLPPSLRNIYKEIEIEFKRDFVDKSGDLTYLAKQGVLLLNPILTVRENFPLSHDNILYKEFCLDIIKYIENNNNPIVYLLWGNKAKQYEKYITNKNHYVIKTSHPSPLSANQGGWFHSNCFINTNIFLIKNNIQPINWLK